MFVRVKDGQIIEGPVARKGCRCASMSVSENTTEAELLEQGWIPYELIETLPSKTENALPAVLSIKANKVIEIRGVEAKSALEVVLNARIEAYGPIADQLDEQYHDFDAWKARIAAIKADNPKP